MNVEVEVFSNRPRLRTLPPPHSYGNQRLQRQFDRLLMMGIIMPETRWALSVRQSNKILRVIVASSWVFYLSDWRCTKPQTIKAVDTVLCAPDDGWWYHAKHIEQFPDKMYCVTLYLVGYILE
jgi:hypothetical protein